MTKQLNVGFSRYSQADFMAKAQRIVTAVTDNPNFPEPWSSFTPTLAQLTAALEAYQSALSAATDGGHAAIVTRDTARASLSDALVQLALYLEGAAQGDLQKLNTTGFDLRRVPTRMPVDTLPPPDDLRADRGSTSGTIELRMRPVPGAASYDVQLTAGDPTVEANWAPAGVFARSRGIGLEGLVPGKTYSVRVRGIGRSGPGAWTSGVSLMVV